MKKILLGLATILLAASSARAQFIGFTSPQTEQQTLAAAVNCGGTQHYAVINLGQTQHFVTATLLGSNVQFNMTITGTDTLSNLTVLSDTAVAAGASTVALQASGYYPIVTVNVTCTGGSYSVTYEGASATNPIPDGDFQRTHYAKSLWVGVSAGSNQTQQFSPPDLNSSGVLTFQYTVGVSGSTLAVQCTSLVQVIQTFTFSLANTAAQQTFVVPPSACASETVTYTSGGAGGNFNLSQSFNQKGTAVNTTMGAYVHVTGTTATAVKATNGTLINVNVNTPAVGTISIFDLATASCTATPSTNTVAVITGTSTAPVGTFLYNLQFLNGICVKASAAMDFTVSYQ